MQKSIHMKKIYLLPVLLFLFFNFAARAQMPDSCTYTLELFDSFGDGWNGAAVVIIAGGDTTAYTLDNVNDNGSSAAFEQRFMNGDTVTFFFESGSFDAEVAYAISNPEGLRIFVDGPSPTPNTPITAVIECPSCFVSQPDGVELVDVRAFTAEVEWNPPIDSSAERYLVEYGLQGFDRGTGTVIETAETSAVLGGLMEFTTYDFYLSSICSGQDTSRAIGPFEFTTLYANDMGITEILTPETQCGLGTTESVTVTLRNFGGQPQSLVPFKYSVNGVDAGVPIPIDGFLTDVLGKDSTFTVEFEKQFDFSMPGEYIIQAWTELENDSDTANDTTTVTILSIPTIDALALPYQMGFEEWSGGWTVAEDSQNPSWELGMPSGEVITAAANGQNAWVTNLDGAYNLNETSYLLSPCMDFSGLDVDPRISFSIFIQTEACCDEGWLEMSTDGGDTWNKVGTAGTGINWYNDEEDNYWNGDGGFEGWVTASNILEGAAGEADVRLRFVFSSDFALAQAGMGIDDIFISTPLARDLAALTAANQNTDECGTAEDAITVTISNFGTSLVNSFDVNYQANEGEIITENISDANLMPGEQLEYTFDTPLNTTEETVFNVSVWASAPGELFPANDTTTFRFTTAETISFLEDFEGEELPENWSADSGTNVVDSHGNASFVVADNLSNIDQRMEVITPAIGRVEAGDSLVFEYRVVDFDGGGTIASQLGEGDSIIVEISLDCGETYSTIRTINADNHNPSATLQPVTIYLDDYAGEVVKFRLQAFWGAGDYWVDFDNFNIIRCPETLDLVTEISDETTVGASNGQATVNPGTGFAPFDFEWSNGSTDRTAVRLSPGMYSVTVTDRFGCSDEASVQIGTTTDVFEPEIVSSVSLSPNPTTMETLLRVELTQTTDVQVQLFNLSGQLIFQAQERNVNALTMPIDLSNQPAGMYILRLLADRQLYTEKLVKTN